jgi:hypothetical protein
VPEGLLDRDGRSATAAALGGLRVHAFDQQPGVFRQLYRNLSRAFGPAGG